MRLSWAGFGRIELEVALAKRPSGKFQSWRRTQPAVPARADSTRETDVLKGQTVESKNMQATVGSNA